MPKKKKSPKSIPATRADIEKIRRTVKDEAVEEAMAIILTALTDKMGWELPQIIELWKHIEEIHESIMEKRITVPDLKDVLKQEHGVVFK